MISPRFDVREVPSPSYVVDLGLLRGNLEILKRVQKESGGKILLAQKGYALWATYPLLSQYLAGCCASGLHEALLAHEEFDGEVHVYAPAYKHEELVKLVEFSGHLSFNSTNEWKRHRPFIQSLTHPPSCGLRVNPGYSEVEIEIYNPCAPGSRLGARREEVVEEDLEGLEGLHFHSMCEQDSDVLERTLVALERDWDFFLKRVKWVNFGGGHHITKPGYDVERLIRLIRDFSSKWNVQVYLEPGEAIGINTGYLVSSVLDVIGKNPTRVILDTSATAHMPDTLEMPYRAEIDGAGHPGDFPYEYRLGGTSCLAGDVMGDYSFPEALEVGHRVVFMDMTHYTMVKTTTFNGVPHPSIVLFESEDGSLKVVRKFQYLDYKNRLS